MQTRDPAARPEHARGASADEKTGPPRQTRHWRWADLMRRAFDIDVLACPHCGNRMRLLATIEYPRGADPHPPGAAERAGAGGPRPAASNLRFKPLRRHARLSARPSVCPPVGLDTRGDAVLRVRRCALGWARARGTPEASTAHLDLGDEGRAEE